MQKDIAISSLSVGIAEFATLPICTIKTNYQNTKSNSIVETAKNIYANRGLFGFYRSGIASIGSQVVSTSSKYVLYRKLISLYDQDKINHFKRVQCGFISGISTTLITHPIDVYKIHLQMGASLYSVIKENGLKTLYRGYSKTFFKVMIGSCMYFPLYDTIHTEMKRQNIKYTSFLSSIITAVASVMIQHPIDHMKTRQVYGLSIYLGMNPLSYYKGVQLNLLRVVPHFVITMTCIDYLANQLK